MHSFKLISLVVLFGVLCSGCTETVRAVRNGQPDLSAANFMITVPTADGVPAGCLRIETSEEDKKTIRNCAEDMRRMIDNKYYAYRHDLFSLATTGNTTADAAITVAGVVGTVVAPPTTKWLSALIAGISGLKETANTDLLYKNSILLILLQMDKDRASQNTIIQKNLDANSYQTMGEAATDLYSYFIAGTWDDALLKMQSDAGAQAAQCEAELKNAKLNAAASQTAAATATSQCGATKASSATPLPAPIAITFALGQSDTSKQAIALSDLAVSQFNAAESSGNAESITIVGGAAPTYNIGKNTKLQTARAKENKDLATARADAVKALLVKAKVDPNKITTTGAVNGTLTAVITFLPDKPASRPTDTPADKQTDKPVDATPAAQPAATDASHADVTPKTAPLFGTADLTAGAAFNMKDGTPIKIVGAPDSHTGKTTYVKAVNGKWDDPKNKISIAAADLIEQLVAKLPG